MIRNIVGCLVAVGSGARPPRWLAEVLATRDRSLAAATFAPDGLYFLGPYYDAVHGIPERTAGDGLAALSAPARRASAQHEPADADQDLRRLARGRHRRRGARRAPTPSASSSTRRARASSRRSAPRELARALPPYVTPVGLFVNADACRHRSRPGARSGARPPVPRRRDRPTQCNAFERPYLRAARMAPGLDLLDFSRRFSEAQGLLLDAHVEGFGGGGKAFDWSLVPAGVAASARFVWWVACRKRRCRHPAAAALGR